MAQQTRVILRSNISSGQVPPKEIATSRFSSTVGLYDSNPAHLARDFSLMTYIVKVPLYTEPADKP